MSSGSFDCVIVGARCAGAPLAVHLARAGMRVCVVDADKLPSDQPFSTHAIQPAGMQYLDEIGVGAKVRAVTPPSRTLRLKIGQSHVDIHTAPGREVYAPRRSTLDPMLAEAAVAAGADLRDETAVLDLVRDGDRVVGVRARRGGKTEEIRARCVVGADGRNSTVAKRVRAEEYFSYEAPRAGYWAYWPATPEFKRLPFQAGIDIRGNDVAFVFYADGDLVVSGALTATTEVKHWKKDIEGNVRAAMARADLTRAVLASGNRPVTPFVGLLKGKFFFRKPFGPGWALVGDAGLHKDPAPGYGITDALRDARALSRAILDGREAAFELYWHERDVASLPLFANAEDMGGLGYDNPFNRLVFDGMNSTPSLRPRMLGVMDRTILPQEMVPPWLVLFWLGKGILRGRTEILPHFAASSRRISILNKELAKRRALAGEARRRLEAS